jgi:hypothetical protein
MPHLWRWFLTAVVSLRRSRGIVPGEMGSRVAQVLYDGCVLWAAMGCRITRSWRRYAPCRTSSALTRCASEALALVAVWLIHANAQARRSASARLARTRGERGRCQRVQGQPQDL